MYVKGKYLKSLNKCRKWRFYVFFKEGNLLLMGGADSATSSLMVFPAHIFPQFSHQGCPRLIHVWCKRNLCKKVHFSTNWKKNKYDEISGNLLLMGGGAESATFVSCSSCSHFGILLVTFLQSCFYKTALNCLVNWFVKKISKNILGMCDLYGVAESAPPHQD